MLEDYLSKTPQGYTYLPVHLSHILNWGGLGLCDLCNQNIQHGYLVFVLNKCICSRCLNEWIERANVYPEDLAYQKENQLFFYDWHIQHGHIDLSE